VENFPHFLYSGEHGEHMRRNIAELISKVLDEEIVSQDFEGKIDQTTVEEALVRVTVKRALDPRSRLGMEAQRYLTEYVYGKPVQPSAVVFKNISEFDDMDTDVLYQRQLELLKGAMNGDYVESSEDPTRFIEAGQRDEVIQHLLTTRGDVRAAGREAAAERKEEREKERTESIETVTYEETDELLQGMWDL
jgi:hypothetical protein